VGLRTILDTNAVLYWLGGRLAIPLPEGDLAISVITEIEILGYPFADAADEESVKIFLSEIDIIQLTPEIKNHAVSIRRARLLKLPDAIIAASALATDAQLISNDGAFSRVTGLRLIPAKIQST